MGNVVRALVVSASGILMLSQSATAVEQSTSSPRAARAAAEAAARAGQASPAATPATEQPSRIRIRYRDGAQATAAAAGAPDVAAEVSRSGNVSVQSRIRHSDGKTEDLILNRPVSEQELSRIADTVAQNPAVEFAVPEKIERAQQVNDPRFVEQWDYPIIRTQQAWNHSTGNGVVVAVLDTGIRQHEDLRDNLFDGFDMITSPSRSNDGDGRDADASDPGDWCPTDRDAMSSWHGTHVAGTIAAITNNRIGIAGVAPAAKILPVRVLGRCGGSSFDITDGIRWAAGVSVPNVPNNPRPAKVINLSLGGPGPCDADYADAIRQARQRGVTIVVAAGNDDTDASNFRPANCDGVISVAATNKAGARALFGEEGKAGSNFGRSVKIAAPGGEVLSQATLANGILSTLNDGIMGPGNDSYEFYQGTSMAAPHVAGVVALMYQVHPNITPDQVLSLLQSTSQAFPLVSSRRCDPTTCGAGIVNAEAAVLAAESASRLAANSGSAPQTGTANDPKSTGSSRGGK